MSYDKPSPDGDAVKETRAHIRALYAEDKTAICDQPAVTSSQLADKAGIEQRAATNRLRVDPAVTRVSAIDPQTFEPTHAYVLAEDER